MCDVTVPELLFSVPENNRKTKDGLRLWCLVFGLLLQPSSALGLPIWRSQVRLQMFPSVWSEKQSEEDLQPASVWWMLWCFCLVYLCVLNLVSSYLRLEPVPLLHKTTTNAVWGFSEVLVAPNDTVRPSSVQGCRVMGQIIWRRFSLGLDLLVVFF